MHSLVLKPGKEQSVRRRHPWIFSGAILHISGRVDDGDLVEVTDSARNFLGIGHYQPGSIAVRLLSFKKEKIDRTFWTSRLGKALEMRQDLGLARNKETTIFRLVHGEGDGLPGLIIDVFGSTAVLQMHTTGMLKARDEIASALRELPGLPLKAAYDKSSQTLPGRTREGYRDGYLFGEKEQGPFLENGLRFSVDWESGQKTGFFIDQRESRRLLEKYSAGKKVLNLFGYTGGFSVYALRGGAARVDTVDSSKPAIEMANRNVALNPGLRGEHRGLVSDALEFLGNTGMEYDLMVLDPPAYAKHGEARQNALQGYRRLNQAAMEKMPPGGILFTFSCSQVVSPGEFRRSVFVAAATAGKNVRILHQLHQPPDHPVSIYHPEGEYLKGLVLRVE